MATQTSFHSSRFGSFWKDPFILIMIGLFLTAVVAVIIIFVTIYCRMGMETLTEQTFGIRLMQMTLGMLIGLAVTFLGVVAAWYGMKESFQMEAESTNWAGKLASTGPGALLVICGTILIYTCIQKEFRITDAEPIPDIRYERIERGPS